MRTLGALGAFVPDAVKLRTPKMRGRTIVPALPLRADLTPQ